MIVWPNWTVRGPSGTFRPQSGADLAPDYLIRPSPGAKEINLGSLARGLKKASVDPPSRAQNKLTAPRYPRRVAV